MSTGLAPSDFVFLRFATAALIMLSWLLRHGPTTLGPVGWGKGLVLALVAGPVFIAFGVGGYVHAPLAHGAVIQPSVITLGATLFAWAVLREKLSANRLIGTAVIVAGLLLIATSKDGVTAPNAWIGDLLFVGAGLFWTAFTILIKRWGIGGVPATAAVSIVSAAFVVPGFVLFGTFERLAALDPATLVTQIVVQGVFSGVLAVIAYGKAVTYLGAGKAALFPAAALLTGIPVTGEMPSPIEWTGALVATLGLAVAMGVLKPRR